MKCRNIRTLHTLIVQKQPLNYTRKNNFKASEKTVDDIYLRLAQASLKDKNIENELKMMGLICDTFNCSLIC